MLLSQDTSHTHTHSVSLSQHITEVCFCERIPQTTTCMKLRSSLQSRECSQYCCPSPSFVDPRCFRPHPHLLSARSFHHLHHHHPASPCAHPPLPFFGDRLFLLQILMTRVPLHLRGKHSSLIRWLPERQARFGRCSVCCQGSAGRLRLVSKMTCQIRARDVILAKDLTFGLDSGIRNDSSGLHYERPRMHTCTVLAIKLSSQTIENKQKIGDRQGVARFRCPSQSCNFALAGGA